MFSFRVRLCGFVRYVGNSIVSCIEADSDRFFVRTVATVLTVLTVAPLTNQTLLQRLTTVLGGITDETFTRFR